MGRKKMLVADGFFDEDVAPEEHHAPIEVPTAEIELDEFFCQFCDQGFVTEKGQSIHEKRWCKEKPVEEPDLSVVPLEFEEVPEEIDEDWEEI